MNTYKDILAWLGYVFISPIAVLALVAFLLGACTPVVICPDLRCEYGYGEAPTEAPAPSPEPEKGDDKGDRDGKGKGHDKGDRDGDDD